MYCAALRGVAGDRVGQVRCAVAVVAERLAGEAPGTGDRVSVKQATDLDAICGDGLDPQDVAVGQAPARFAGLDVVVVLAADDQVTGGRLRALGYLHRPAAVDQA